MSLFGFEKGDRTAPPYREKKSREATKLNHENSADVSRFAGMSFYINI
jgi:hypothetical protein